MKRLMALGSPARELTSRVLPNRNAIGAAPRLFWAQSRCDLMIAARFA
jgi:hypothetical protein